eukprot:scaffold77060_cov69-Phaeocystis_antarctica.AAC.5
MPVPMPRAGASLDDARASRELPVQLRLEGGRAISRVQLRHPRHAATRPQRQPTGHRLTTRTRRLSIRGILSIFWNYFKYPRDARPRAREKVL